MPPPPHSPERNLPLLSQLVKRIMSAPATSVPAECVFSPAGLTINQQRYSLSPEIVDMLIIIFEQKFVNLNFLGIFSCYFIILFTN